MIQLDYTAILTIVLLLTSLIVSVILPLAQAKKSSSHGPTTKTQSSKPGGFAAGTTGGGFAEEPPIGTEPLTPATANNSAAAAHRLAITSVNASKTKGGPCLPHHFILPLKEARFIVIKQCVTITGRVVWTHYFNDDGDANFNVVRPSIQKYVRTWKLLSSVC